jgi:sarcosine oxidase subunit delta
VVGGGWRQSSSHLLPATRHLPQKNKNPKENRKLALLITCPICGKRSGYEFRYGGEDKGPRPEDANLTPRTWCEYVHMNRCVAGVQKEWWYHRDGCGLWFTVWRDTTTNREAQGPGEDA